MILKLVVLVGLALHLGIQGRWLLALLALGALWPKVGLGIAILLTALLALKGDVWSPVILGAFIIWNLVGNSYFQHRGNAEGAE